MRALFFALFAIFLLAQCSPDPIYSCDDSGSGVVGTGITTGCDDEISSELKP